MDGVCINLPEEYFTPLKRCLNLLNCCSIAVFDRKITFIKRLRYAFMICCVVIFHTSQGVYGNKAFKGELAMFELANFVAIYVICTQTIIKAVIVLSNRNKIKQLILELGEMWRIEGLTTIQNEKKKILLKRLNIFYKAFYWMNMLGSWQYMLAPLTETFIRRYILENESESLLPFSCSFPFDVDENWLAYIIAYVFELYSMCIIIYCYLGCEFLMIALCALLSIEFILLSEDLLHVEPANNEDTTDTHIGSSMNHHTLRNVIRRHQRLIRLTEQLDDIFNKMIFFNLSSAAIIIGFFGFSATVAHGALQMANNFIGGVASVLPIFNICYYADLLRESSLRVSDMAYCNLWYREKKSYQQSILIVLRRAQKPCCITSMKYNPIALHTFTAVMSTTWSYFSLASSLYEG